jgi:hypothetical protein
VLAAISGDSPPLAIPHRGEPATDALRLLASSSLSAVAAQQNREPEKVFYGVKLLIVFNKIMMKL